MCLCIHIVYSPRFAVFAEPAARERAGEGAGSPPQHAPQNCTNCRISLCNLEYDKTSEFVFCDSFFEL